ncbi:MAG: phosphate ABC transporter permease subunit PstC [Bacteroidia bacterium]|nr:phosphate ABC transporter permease subunit PstC [Bacteroidia bacterium]
MKFKYFQNKFMGSVIKLCGLSSAFVIVMMVIFLFKEGSGLFSEPVVEPGYVLAVNTNNKIETLNEVQIKELFDAEIQNWSELGGQDIPITVLRLSDIPDYVSEESLGADFERLPLCIDSLINVMPGIIAFIPEMYIPDNFSGKLIDAGTISLSDFVVGSEWFPTAKPAAMFGLLPLLLGTLWVSIAAILLALPCGLSVAVYMAELASPKTRAILKPIIELLAGIPSVVYGFFGLVVLAPLIQNIFGLDVGETALTGAVILAIMALPTIITVAEDAIRTVPKSVKEASLALGASHWQTIRRVILPYASSGISAAIILGVGRAVGETMAVLMVTGNSAVIPNSLLMPVRTIPATIAAELGEASAGGTHYQALFLLACVLFLMTLVLSLTASYISSKQNKHG